MSSFFGISEGIKTLELIRAREEKNLSIPDTKVSKALTRLEECGAEIKEAEKKKVKHSTFKFPMYDQLKLEYFGEIELLNMLSKISDELKRRMKDASPAD